MRYPKRSQYQYAKSPYRIRNRAEYEAGLRRRGDLTIWLSDDAINSWVEVQLACKILNTMPRLGMTDSYRVE